MLPTMSQHGRALACPASEALPHEASKGGAAADAGTERHEALRLALRGEQVEANPAIKEWLDATMPEAELLRGWEAEVALGYSVAWDEGRRIGVNIGRNYGSVGADEFVGSADYLLVAKGDDCVGVADLKTGRLEPDPPERNQQLLSLALAASRTHGTRSGARLGILRATPGQAPRWLWAEVTQDALEAHASKLGRWLDDNLADRNEVAQGREPRHLRTGAHCRYCPARGACPAQSRALTEATTKAPTFREQWRTALYSGGAAQVWALRQALKGELELLDEALRDAARNGPLDIGDGRTYGWRSIERETIDAEAAWKVLGDAYGLEVARAAMTLETSKAGIERAMRQVVEAAKAQGEKLTVKSAVSRAMDALRAAGAVTKQSTERCEEGKQ